MTKIPIDFMPGSHGHFLETVCNQEFGIVPKEDNFTDTGTSHKKSYHYHRNKLFVAEHWFEMDLNDLWSFPVVVSIQFAQEDLLLLSSVSLHRTGDAKIDSDSLEKNTVTKLTTWFYKDIVKDIKKAYPFVDLSADDIPRYVLREYFKFGFKNPDINGYWLRQKTKMLYSSKQQVLKFNFASFYNYDAFVKELSSLAKSLNFDFAPSDDLYKTHQKFLTLNPFRNHKPQCDQIVDAVVHGLHVDIPKLSLFQESYINGCLENIYNKEMPFHQDQYFTSTKDVLYYLDNVAPNL